MTKPKPEEQQNAFDPKNEAEPGATCYLINEETQEEERILFEDLRPGQLVRFVFRETEKQVSLQKKCRQSRRHGEWTTLLGFQFLLREFRPFQEYTCCKGHHQQGLGG